jgi:hypothetical protein
VETDFDPIQKYAEVQRLAADRQDPEIAAWLVVAYECGVRFAREERIKKLSESFTSGDQRTFLTEQVGPGEQWGTGA